MLALALLLSCAGPDYGLSADVAHALAPGGAGAPGTAETATADPVALPSGGGATSSWRVGSLRRDDFDLEAGGSTALADFLFVVDGSSSMKRVLPLVQQGISALAEQGVFPDRSRLAVMGTTPADDLTPRRAHPSARKRGLARRAPGFVSLVSGDAIDRFRQQAPDAYAARYPLDGCGPWFDPDQRNDQGQPCLVAHTQLPLIPVRVEDGLNAFRQLLERTEGTPLFRTGAAANVVFISDTHAPGFLPRDDVQDTLLFEDLEARRPDLDALRTRLALDHELAAFRVHAIAPRARCGERIAGLGRDYFDVADDSGGVTADVCTTDDYRPVISAVLDSGARVQQPVLAISGPADTIERVTVDGVDVGFSVSPDGRAVVLDAMPSRRARVEVTWR